MPRLVWLRRECFLSRTQRHAGEDVHQLEHGDGLSVQRHSAGADGLADRHRIRGCIHQRVGPSQLTQIVEVGVPHHRFAVSARPSRRPRVEVHATGPEVAPFDCVEQLGVPVERAAEAAARRKVWMRRDDEAGMRLFHPRDVVERLRRLSRGRGEIQQQHMPPADRALDAGDERDSALARVILRARITKLSFVKGDGERVEPEPRGAIDQRRRAVGDIVHRIVAGVKVKVYFQHVRYLQSGAGPDVRRPVEVYRKPAARFQPSPLPASSCRLPAS